MSTSPVRIRTSADTRLRAYHHRGPAGPRPSRPVEAIVDRPPQPAGVKGDSGLADAERRRNLVVALSFREQTADARASGGRPNLCAGGTRCDQPEVHGASPGPLREAEATHAFIPGVALLVPPADRGPVNLVPPVSRHQTERTFPYGSDGPRSLVGRAVRFEPTQREGCVRLCAGLAGGFLPELCPVVQRQDARLWTEKRWFESIPGSCTT